MAYIYKPDFLALLWPLLDLLFDKVLKLLPIHNAVHHAFRLVFESEARGETVQSAWIYHGGI